MIMVLKNKNTLEKHIFEKYLSIPSKTNSKPKSILVGGNIMRLYNHHP